MSYQIACEQCHQRLEHCECPPGFPHGVVSPDAVYGEPAKTYWQVIESGRPPTGRFVCAECGYDALVRSCDRGTIRFDCAFCGWGCFHDHLFWWHQKTSQEREQEAREEEYG